MLSNYNLHPCSSAPPSYRVGRSKRVPEQNDPLKIGVGGSEEPSAPPTQWLRPWTMTMI